MIPNIILIIGPAGAGKSTVSEILSKHFEKSAVIDSDTVRNFIKNGYTRPFPKSPEGKRQLTLAVKNSCTLANSIFEAGFNVIIDDVVSTKERLDQYFDLLIQNPKVFLLLPDTDTLSKRDLGRSQEAQMKE